MANQITGKIISISPSQQVASKDGSKMFVKRSLVMDCTRFDQYTGERGFENTPLMEFFDDKCKELDRFQPGQVVTVSFDVRGTRYTNRDGATQIFTRLVPYRIELHQRSATSASPQPSQPATQAAPQAAPQPAWTPPSAPSQTYATAQQQPKGWPASPEAEQFSGFSTRANDYGEPPF